MACIPGDASLADGSLLMDRASSDGSTDARKPVLPIPTFKPLMCHIIYLHLFSNPWRAERHSSSNILIIGQSTVQLLTLQILQAKKGRSQFRFSRKSQ
jgi:hypothetical protein